VKLPLNGPFFSLLLVRYLHQAYSQCALFEQSFIVAAFTVREDPGIVEGMAEGSATESPVNAQTRQGLAVQSETVALKPLAAAGNAVNAGTNRIPMVTSLITHIIREIVDDSGRGTLCSTQEDNDEVQVIVAAIKPHRYVRSRVLHHYGICRFRPQLSSSAQLSQDD